MAIVFNRSERDPQRIADAIVQLTQGRQNSVGDVTLTPSAGSTTVNFVNCSLGSRVFLFPKTAHAAAAVATTYITAANILQGSFTITHANDAQVDKTFSFLCIGG